MDQSSILTSSIFNVDAPLLREEPEMPTTPEKCPICGADAHTELVPPPDWHSTDGRLILSCACEGSCGSMLIDLEGEHPKIESTVQDLLKGATQEGLSFLSRSNSNWVDDVVYEPYLVQRLLEAQRFATLASDRFGFEDADVIGSAGGLDFTHVLVMVEAGERRFTIRVHGARVEERVVRSEAFWLNSLRREARANVPVPLRGLDGQEVERVESSDGSRFCTAYRWIEGEVLARVSSSQRTEAAIACIGETLAKLHNHSGACTFPSWFSRPRYGIERLRQRGVTDPGILDKLEDIGESSENFGLIMHETGALSVILNGDRASLIDFRPFGWGYFLSDVASIRRDLSPDEQGIFLEAYHRTHELPPDHEDLLGFFDIHWRTFR